jgi:hypothetical protein
MSAAEIYNIKDHQRIKTKLVCSSCGAPGEGSCQCGAPYVAPGERAEAAVKANPGKSDRAIAEEIGTSHTTIQRARKSTGTNVPVEKRVGRDGKKRSQPKPRTRPVENRARDAVRSRVETGQPVNARKVGADKGISHVMVEQAAAMERARLEVLNELGVDPETLILSAKAKLEVTKRMLERVLKAEHAQRMRNLDEEVRQRVLKDTEARLQRLEEMENAARANEELYQRMVNNHKPLFTIDQFNLLRKCLHQHGIAATSKDFDEAFNLIQTKKLQLTGQK